MSHDSATDADARFETAATPPAALAAALDRVRIVATPEERDRLLAALLDTAANETVVVDFLNQHAGNMLGRDTAFRKNFLATDCIFRDGIGSRLALNLRRRSAGLNMNGTDLIPRLTASFAQRCATIARGAGTVMIYFGTREPWLSLGVRGLVRGYNGPVVTRDGFHNDLDYLLAVKPYRGHQKLIVLGMGMPRQEAVAQSLKRADIGPALIVCGGAIIDFAAGRFARAPRWMRAAGLEWLFRLANEPRRLFRRYVIGIPVFLFAALRAAMQPSPTAAKRPFTEN